MRKHLHIDLGRRSARATDMRGEDIVRAGRYFIAKALLAAGAAKVDPLSPANPLIFSAGPLAGTTFSNANRLSVGCRSPLTGGIKEANTGGTFAFAMGQQSIAALTLEGAAEDWVVVHLKGDGTVAFDSARPYLGKGNVEAAALLHQAYGENTSLALCGPVGEYLGLMAGIATSDRELRPSRIAARGGVGAVMGAKKVKAVVADLGKMPPLVAAKPYFGSARDYATKLGEQPAVKMLHDLGTAWMADFLNYTGGMPVRNFRAGRLVDAKVEPLATGGEHMRKIMLERGGHPSHSCMPGCVIQCSNVWVDETGKELVSPIEYETLCLVGTNCGVYNPDDIARLNHAANDLGVDTIEFGATLAVMMEAGQAPFGDVPFMHQATQDMLKGTERGRLIAQGAARVGRHFKVSRVPTIKDQAISAYDPRVVEVTGVSMMTTAQGADHTAGNMPAAETIGKPIADLIDMSYQVQLNAAVADSLGLCIFGRSVTDTNYPLLAEAINQALGTSIDAEFIKAMAGETLRMEFDFNREAGFTPADDVLPGFFLTEPLPPTDRVGRLHSAEVAEAWRARIGAARG